jgi:hypothetical protein
MCLPVYLLTCRYVCVSDRMLQSCTFARLRPRLYSSHVFASARSSVFASACLHLCTCVRMCAHVCACMTRACGSGYYTFAHARTGYAYACTCAA